MCCNVELSNPMKTRKRALVDENSDYHPATKHRRVPPKSSLPTPKSSLPTPKSSLPTPKSSLPTSSPTTASTNDPSTQQLKTPKQPSRVSPQSNSGSPKRGIKDLDSDRAPAPASKRRRHSSSNPPTTWFCDRWLSQLSSVQEKVKDSKIQPTIEAPASPSMSMPIPESQAASDQMSRQQDEENQAPDSVASAQSEKLSPSHPKFRGALKMNGIVIDHSGEKIPIEIKELVDKHIRKQRQSPPLGEDAKTGIRQQIDKVWIKGEAMVSNLLNSSLFPLDVPGISEGRDILWSTKPLPRNTGYSCVLPAPKTDRHFGFPISEESKWTVEELSAADHPQVRPYSYPTRETLFPSFLVELKSEATNGTIYEGENQAAQSGAHRVHSLLWMLNTINPSRTRSSTDALVFSAVVSQRVAVAHVHYYNPNDNTVYMSYIDIFPLRKDPQGCRDYHKNVADWLLEIQQPIVRDVLRQLHPIVMLWKKRRCTTAIGDTTANEEGRPNKRQKT